MSRVRVLPAAALPLSDVGQQRPRPSSLDPYKAHLRAGFTGRRGSVQALHREITAQGFTGNYSTVHNFLQC